MNLEYAIEKQEPVIVFSLKGKITSDIDYEDLEKDVFAQINKNHHQIIFDLADLTHTNSSGISFFMRTLTKTRILGGELILVNINGNVEKIFNISKLNEIYVIYKDRDEAMNHFKKLQ